ncbi:MAG: hypothetical protein IJO48_02865, partial [Clostridia bacterium]|nr:hypothetical protein [Clostridia bacterium]
LFYGREGTESYPKTPEYELYLAANSNKQAMPPFEYAPTVSVLVPVSTKNVRESLEKQTYTKWELVNDASSVTGDFVMLLAHDCVLTDDALECFVCEINKNMSADTLFSDEDRINEKGVRSEPHFKPDYSETTLLSYNSIGLPIMVNRRVFAKLGNIKSLDASALYDIALKCAAYSDNVIHIPKVLLSRKSGKETIDAQKGLDSIKFYLQEKRSGALMEEGMTDGTFRVYYTRKQRVTLGIVILNNDDVESLRRLLESIEECMFNIPKKIVVVSYGTNDSRAQMYYKMLEEQKAVKMVYGEGYNYSKLCNHGAQEADSDLILFLDRSMEVISPKHIEVLMDSAHKTNIGAVGAKILDENGKIAECGIVAGLYGTYGSLYTGEDDDSSDIVKNRFINIKRAVMAVSGDCLMIKSDTFFNMGGFDETIKNPDAAVELCLRLTRKHLTNIYDPYSVMIKHRAFGSSWERSEDDNMRMYDTLRIVLQKGDPYYNKNYDYACAVPQIAVNPYPPIELNEKYK